MQVLVFEHTPIRRSSWAKSFIRELLLALFVLLPALRLPRNSRLCAVFAATTASEAACAAVRAAAKEVAC